ncbi:MAG: radical SAM protein [Acidobacteriota bacterium]|nr:radical SAM protein [Acidobacteriota bacterium]
MKHEEHTRFIREEYERSELWSRKRLGAFTNVVRASLERRLRKTTLRSLPFVLYLEPTTFCNLKCPACPTGLGVLGRPKARLSVDEFKNTIDALGDSLFLLVMYNWGEPLLHKRFAGLVRYAAERGIVVHASSNLSVPLTEAQCRDVVSSGLQLLLVGVDGATPDTHARYRQGSRLPVVLENLRKLAAAKRQLGSISPHIVAEFLVFSHNQHEIPEFERQMDDIGVCTYTQAPLLPPGDSLEMADGPAFDRYRRHQRTIEALRRKGRSLKPCTWLHYSSIINPGGSISPCCMVSNEASDFGRVTQTKKPAEMGRDFRTQWNGRKYTAARRLFRRETVARWAAKNLRLREPDGMGLSQARRATPMICAECPIPEDVEVWSDLVSEMYQEFTIATRRALTAFEIRPAARAGVRAALLGIAKLLQ